MVKRVKRLKAAKRLTPHLVVGWALVLVPFIIFGLGHFIPISSKYVGVGTDPCGPGGPRTLRYQVLLGNIPIMRSEGTRADYDKSQIPMETNVDMCFGGNPATKVQYSSNLYLW